VNNFLTSVVPVQFSQADLEKVTETNSLYYGHPIGWAILFWSCGFLILSSTLFLTYSQRSGTGCLPYHTIWHYCKFRMHLWNVLHAAHWKHRMQKLHQKNLHLRPSHNFVGLCQYFATIRQSDKNLFNSNIYSTSPHNVVNFWPLTAEIGWRVWVTPANFNGFRILASLLHRRRSTEVNQTLHDFWQSSMLVHYIYIFGCSCPLMEFCHVQNWLYVQVLRSPILAALPHGTRVVGISQTAAFSGLCHLYSADSHVGHRPTF